MEAVLQELDEIFAGRGRQLYLVGGSVRDQILGRSSPDVDLTTDATPREIREMVNQVGPESVYCVGERFGTIGMVSAGRRFEITTFRSEEYHPKSRKPTVSFGTSLEADLARRDFTINAMAQDLRAGRLVDPFGGLEDLRAEVIRAVGKPSERFEEDPLRLMRAVRFASDLGFKLDPVTKTAIAAMADSLQNISRERVAEELNKVLLSPSPSLGIRLLVDLGLMQFIIPEVLQMRGMSQEGWHHKDVYEHVLLTLDNSARLRRELSREDQVVLTWAALLHDIGKPRVRGVIFDCRLCGYSWGEDALRGPAGALICPKCGCSELNATVHFRWHEQVGSEMATQIMLRLRQDKRAVERVGRLVLLHTRSNSYAPDWTDAAVRRFIREAETELDLMFALSRADITSQRPARVEAALGRVEELESRCRDLLAKENVAALSSPLDGNELMAMFATGPGPWIRGVKEYLLSLVIEGFLSPDDKETAKELAGRFMAQQRSVR